MKAAEIKRFSDAILALQLSRGEGGDASSFLDAMRALLDADHYTVYRVEKASFADLLACHPKIPIQAPLSDLNRHIIEHPLYSQLCNETPDTFEVGRWSDGTTLGELQRTAIYKSYYRFLGVRDQIDLTCCNHAGSIIGLAFSRTGRNFSDSERDWVQLLGAHLRVALKEATVREELQEKLTFKKMALDGTGIIIASDSGKVIYETSEASDLIREYFRFTSKQVLPPELCNWINKKPDVAKLYSKNSKDGRLLCKCGPSVMWPGGGVGRITGTGGSECRVYRLRLEEEKWSASLAIFREFGFTAREAEVLQWIISGKRNREIAIIQGTSPRTIGKHVEHIIAKLGVETRTAAAVQAMEIINEASPLN